MDDEKLPPGDYVIGVGGAITDREGNPVSLTDYQGRLIVWMMENERMKTATFWMVYSADPETRRRGEEARAEWRKKNPRPQP